MHVPADRRFEFSKRATTFAMLALLVMRRGQPLTRESLAFTLFPDHDEPSALAELRRCIYLANKALPERAGEPWQIADADTIRWNDATDAFVDVIAFERLGLLARMPPERRSTSTRAIFSKASTTIGS